MACGGCMGARALMYSGIRTGNVRAVGQAVQQAVHINVDKARQMYRRTQEAVKATPYRRPPVERTQ